MTERKSITMSAKNVTIVGAGIIGACLAHRLARVGLGVRIIDAIGPHAGASGRSWAWINAVSATRRDYFDLRHAGIAAWHDLEQELAGNLDIDWSGALVWDQGLFNPNRTSMQQQDWGAAVRLLDQDAIRDVEPLLSAPPDAAFLSMDDGLVDGAGATAAILAAARALGARTAYGHRVTGLLRNDTHVTGVETDYGRFEADVTILAAGEGTAALLELAGMSMPVANRAGMLVTTTPVEGRLCRPIWSDTVHVKQLRDGRLVIGEYHHPDGALDDPDETAERMLAEVSTWLPALGPLRIETTTIVRRPIPGDGMPVIGAVPEMLGLYVATMHSGFSLAAIVGQLVAQEVIHNQEQDILAPFRPARFMS